MPAERAGYTVTMFVIDVSPSLGEMRTIELPPGPEGEPRSKKITNLEWALQFVLLKVQEMIFNGRKTDQCGVILFGTAKTENCVHSEHGGYENVTEYIPIAQPTSKTLEMISAIKPSTVEGDPLDGLIVAIQTQAKYLGKKASWTRRITLITDGASAFSTSDWEDTAEKLNELGVYTTIIGIDFDDEEFTEKNKSDQKRKNEAFFHDLESRVVEGLLGSCYQALEDCALPDVKSVKPTAKGITFLIGDSEVQPEEAIEISARVHKVTSKASSITLKKFIRRDGKDTNAKDDDGDATMSTDAGDAGKESGDGDGAEIMYSVVERETKYVVKPPPPEKDKKDQTDSQAQTQEDLAEEEEEKPGIQVDADDLVKGYKYGATWVLVDDGFEKLPIKMGIEVIGFMHTSKLNRSYLMGEVYCLSADPNSSRSQVALSSFIRAMVIKDVLAIVRWVHSNDAEPRMAICSPVVEGAADYMFMVRVPFAEDIRNYTFPSLDNLKNRKGELVSKHPHLTTDDMVDAMEKWVDDMDLMKAEDEADGTRGPWFDISCSYNPAIHRIKQALFHAAIVTDLEKDPLPPPHPELTRYFQSPEPVREKAKKSLETLRKVLDVKLVPPKVKGKKKVNIVDATEHIGEEFSVADLLGEDPSEAEPIEPSASLASLSLKGDASHASAGEKVVRNSKQKDNRGSDTEDEDDDAGPPTRSTKPRPMPQPKPQLPTPSKSPADAVKKSPPKSRTRVETDIRPGRIIGNAFPLDDFRNNLERGDVVSKALQDMGVVITEIVEESFSTQRYDEAISCMKEMRDTALKEDDVGLWNIFIQGFKKKCTSKGFKHKDFWDRVKAIGMSISLITDKEADRHEGYSEFTEMQSVQFINS
ncbi:ATP-dependent DNA helicase II subunit 2 [Tulasnella sp. JGI-2019a]|nr:ATP-dependent DNA helicase II subunit 2 [Tulasnella sp. JGI-2019a]